MNLSRAAGAFLAFWLAVPPVRAQNLVGPAVPAGGGSAAPAASAAGASAPAPISAAMPTVSPAPLALAPAFAPVALPVAAPAAAAWTGELALALPAPAALATTGERSRAWNQRSDAGAAVARVIPNTLIDQGIGDKSNAAPRRTTRPEATALGALRSLAPRLSGGGIADTLDRFFSGLAFRSGADLASALAPGRFAEPAFAAPAAADRAIEEFARAGEQAFYEGRLLPGEHGAVVLAPRADAPREVAPSEARAPPKATPAGELPDEGELRRRMELPTLTNPQREEKAIELFQLGGAAKEVVTLKPGEKPAFDRFHTIFRQDAGRGRHNLFVVKPGRRADKVIVVGAHHDKVSVGEGKIDNWSGTTLVANLYQAMKDVDTEATYVFTLFSREEEGLIGSDVFVRSLAPEVRARIRSMVNVDTVGVDGTFSWRNNSSRYLLDVIARVAKEKALALKEISFSGGDADSSSFKRFTHAMTIFGASPDVIFDIIHSRNDNMGAFSMPHYVNAVKLTLALLQALDREDPPRPAALVAEQAPRGPPAGPVASAWGRLSRWLSPPAMAHAPERSRGRHFYHGTSWKDLVQAAEEGGFSPGISYFAPAPHFSEAYARARARKRSSTAVLLEFDGDQVAPLVRGSGSVLKSFPAYLAVRRVPLAHLTPASKEAVLLQLEREAGTLHAYQHEYLRRALIRAFGGDI